MSEGPFPILGRKGTQEKYPTLMKRIEKGQRSLDGGQAAVGQLGPTIFHVGFNRGFIFGKSQLETDVTVEVAVGNMMNDLPYRPSAIPIRCVQLFF